MSGRRYRVQHQTVYGYAGPVVHAHHLLHLAPRPTPWQTTGECRIDITPRPASTRREVDAWGNPVTRIEIDRPHERLEVALQLEVEVHARPVPAPGSTPPWEQVRDGLHYVPRPLDDERHEALRYRVQSPHVPIKGAFGEFARECFPEGRGLFEACVALNEHVHARLRYEPGATAIGTPLLEVLERRTGVCQDYAHLMIACLRSLGLAARYVSGYLRTTPPAAAAAAEGDAPCAEGDAPDAEGSAPGLVGADASHAWVAAYLPPHGWVEFDPTNRMLVGQDHVVLGWGRDFSDVSPLRGVILGGGAHTLAVGVKVTPLD